MELILIAEGTSDKVLIPPIQWLCNDIQPHHSYEIEPFVLDGISPKLSLTEKIGVVLRQSNHQIILVHRDQDNTDRVRRAAEICLAIETAEITNASHHKPHYIPVIPVTMTEAWLLIDEAAIKKAAGFPNNRVALNLPKPRQLESIADPKSMLNDTIKTASGRTGRKLKKVRPHQIMHTLADTIDTYAPLDELSAFRQLRQDLTMAIDALS